MFFFSNFRGFVTLFFEPGSLFLITATAQASCSQYFLYKILYKEDWDWKAFKNVRPKAKYMFPDKKLGITIIDFWNWDLK